jgi:hypothetical protein
VPIVSNPSTSVPAWNQLPTNFLESLFHFASEHLQDNGAILLIHGAEIPLLKSEIRSFFEDYKFTTFKDWWRMNRLQLANGKDSTKMVSNQNASFMSNISFP